MYVGISCNKFATNTFFNYCEDHCRLFFCVTCIHTFSAAKSLLLGMVSNSVFLAKMAEWIIATKDFERRL